ncbi:class I SAM-dependent methyltransferase [Streptomyces californicus]|uniref:class I SAM-dependent methyltransferase n=1 Tax=Streptomyces californicus TaxID=67351 RepID=UPI0036A9DB21
MTTSPPRTEHTPDRVPAADAQHADEGAGTAYSARHAEIYDHIHAARGRDWDAEANAVARLVFERRPGARSVLDVACGTGAHLRRLREHFPVAEGLELSGTMREIAAARLPGSTVHRGDMRDFDLGTEYDAVLCMCFSMGYMASTVELAAAARSLARALAPGGVVVAEPWWFPEQFLDGFVTGSVAESDGLVVSRVSRSVREGRRSLMTVRYTVADRAGLRAFTELETYSLFTHEEYTAAFTAAGLDTTYLPGPPNGRGLYVGVRT